MNDLSRVPIVELGQYPNQGETLLSLKEIAEHLKVSYEHLRVFADAPGLKAAIGAVEVVGVKGVRYPALAEQKFALLLSAQQNKLVTPATAAAYLEQTQLAPGAAPSQSLATSSASVPVSALVEGFAQLLQQAIPPPEDCLLSGDQASALLHCSKATLRKCVAPVKRGLWRKSDILRFIQSL